MNRSIGIGELVVSNEPEKVLITHSLGSCLGVAVFDPEAKVAGLVHCQLPLAKQDDPRIAEKPGLFVDVGVPALFDHALALGAAKRRLIVKIAGGAKMMDSQDMFRIGERNVTVLRKLLWKNDLLLKAADVGGDKPRTMSIAVAGGEVVIRSCGEQWTL